MPSSRDHVSPQVTVVVPNWNGIKWLDNCLEALNQQDATEFSTLCVDNGSTDGSVAFIKKNYPHVDLVSLSTNTGFANAVNVGIERATTPFIALLNADTQACPDWLSTLVARMQKLPPDVVAISSQMLRMDDRDRLDDAGDDLSWYGAATKRGHNQPFTNFDEEEEVFSPCAGAALYRREFLLKAGCFDSDFFAYLEDVDLGVRGRMMGYRYHYLPSAKVLHKGHGSEIHHNRYVELVTCNRLLLFAKNIPASLLLRHAARIVFGQFYFFVIYRRPLASLRGYLCFFAQLPNTLKKRKQVLENSVISTAELDRLLGRDSPRPTLFYLIKRWLSGLLGSKNSALTSG